MEVVEQPSATPQAAIEFKPADVEHLIINKPVPPFADPNIKWRSLEHRGVTFYPRYEPHGKPLLFKVSPTVH